MDCADFEAESEGLLASLPARSSDECGKRLDHVRGEILVAGPDVLVDLLWPVAPAVTLLIAGSASSQPKASSTCCGRAARRSPPALPRAPSSDWPVSVIFGRAL
jgi:hypothetical protein